MHYFLVTATAQLFFVICVTFLCVILVVTFPAAMEHRYVTIPHTPLSISFNLIITDV